jgi:type IV pilus assembly protein PilW
MAMANQVRSGKKTMQAACYRCQQGMTLVEIMIALLIGLVLLGGIIQIFINTRQTYQVESALSRLQENGRFAMEFLARDIRMADYRECQTATPPSMKDVSNNNIALNAIAGDTYDGTVNATHSALDLPDTINVRWSTGGCNARTATTPRPATEEQPENRVFGISGGNLYQGTSATVLVEDVENMQIRYGVDSDGDTYPNYFVAGTATNFPALSNWASVVAVRVSLLLRTDDNIASEPLPYTYNFETYTPADRRIRRVFTSTFTLRNRIR